MTVTASAAVPAANRLIDADTVNLTAVRQAAQGNQGRWPANETYTGRATVRPETPAELGHRIWELTRAAGKPMSDRQIAKQLGITEAAVNEAVTAYLATRPADAVMALGRRVDHLMSTTDLSPQQIAERVGTSVDEALDARTDLICWEEGAVRLIRTPDQVRPEVDWFDRPVTQQCAVDWCRGDCVLGGPDELGHNRTLVNAQVADGSIRAERRRLLVQLQQFQSPILADNDAEATVYLSTGDTDEYGAVLTLDEAEALALAILTGVRAARAAR